VPQTPSNDSPTNAEQVRTTPHASWVGTHFLFCFVLCCVHLKQIALTKLGWLEKKGQKRFFILKNEVLYWFAHEQVRRDELYQQHFLFSCTFVIWRDFCIIDSLSMPMLKKMPKVNWNYLNVKFSKVMIRKTRVLQLLRNKRNRSLQSRILMKLMYYVRLSFHDEIWIFLFLDAYCLILFASSGKK
jgi:hypothetical protein